MILTDDARGKSYYQEQRRTEIKDQSQKDRHSQVLRSVDKYTVPGALHIHHARVSPICHVATLSAGSMEGLYSLAMRWGGKAMSQQQRLSSCGREPDQSVFFFRNRVVRR